MHKKFITSQPHQPPPHLRTEVRLLQAILKRSPYGTSGIEDKRPLNVSAWPGWIGPTHRGAYLHTTLVALARLERGCSSLSPTQLHPGCQAADRAAACTPERVRAPLGPWSWRKGFSLASIGDSKFVAMQHLVANLCLTMHKRFSQRSLTALAS